jgi:hypothetical protein
VEQPTDDREWSDDGPRAAEPVGPHADRAFAWGGLLVLLATAITWILALAWAFSGDSPEEGLLRPTEASPGARTTTVVPESPVPESPD